MTLRDIAKLIEGEVLCGEARLDETIVFAFASDLMSDVLTVRIDNFLLITGLANIQAIRTAEMSDVQYVLLVRGKKPTDEMIRLADDNGMVLIRTNFSLFKTSGLLYSAGIKPVY